MNSLLEAPVSSRWWNDSTTTETDWRWSESTSESRAPYVEYVGRTALVVTGPYTGARYRFLQPGARVSVDSRDRQAMLSIPMLRAVAA